MSIPAEIKQRLPARQVLEFYGLQVDDRGFCRCPFHQGDKNGSLRVYDRPGGGWHCFACGEGTSVIDFVMKYFGLSFKDAQVKLNEDFRLGLDIGRELTPAEKAEAIRRARELKEAAQQRQRIKESLQAAVDRALSAFVLIDRWLLKHEITGRVLAQYDAAWYNYLEARSKLDAFIANSH